MENNLIVIEQLPVITERLQEVKTAIERRVNDALSLVCTEETYKDIKKVRAELNKEYQELEAKRKEVKAAVMDPYNRFEAAYKQCAGEIYQKADIELRAKISEVENGLKEEKAQVLAAYFETARQAKGLNQDFVTLERAGIRVGLSDNATALKKKADEFLNRIEEDLKAINCHPDRDELMAEYRNTLNLPAAMTAVSQRHEEIERAKVARIKIEAEQAMKQIPLHKVPDDIPDDIPEDIPEVTKPAGPERYILIVTATPDQMAKLNNWLRFNGYEYELEG